MFYAQYRSRIEFMRRCINEYHQSLVIGPDQVDLLEVCSQLFRKKIESLKQDLHDDKRHDQKTH